MFVVYVLKLLLAYFFILTCPRNKVNIWNMKHFHILLKFPPCTSLKIEIINRENQINLRNQCNHYLTLFFLCMCKMFFIFFCLQINCRERIWNNFVFSPFWLILLLPFPFPHFFTYAKVTIIIIVMHGIEQWLFSMLYLTIITY